LHRGHVRVSGSGFFPPKSTIGAIAIGGCDVGAGGAAAGGGADAVVSGKPQLVQKRRLGPHGTPQRGHGFAAPTGDTLGCETAGGCGDNAGGETAGGCGETSSVPPLGDGTGTGAGAAPDTKPAEGIIGAAGASPAAGIGASPTGGVGGTMRARKRAPQSSQNVSWSALSLPQVEQITQSPE
jgi:hypothetical protein